MNEWTSKTIRATLCILCVLWAGCSEPSTKPADRPNTTTDLGSSADVGVDPDKGHQQKPRTFDPSALPECEYDNTFRQDHVVLYGEAEQRNVSFILALCEYAAGVGESSLYRADYFEFSWDNVRVVANPEVDVEYLNSHHNWADRLVANVDEIQVSWSVMLNQDEQRFDHTVSATSTASELEETPVDVTCPNCRNYQFVVIE